MMNPQITILTLGVRDLRAAYRFYHEGLGLPSEGIVGEEYPHGAVAFFRLHGGLTLALWPRKDIAWDAGVAEAPAAATEMTIGHNVGSSEEVDRIMALARDAGAVIVKPAGETFWGGYAGYFQDPDSHLWEVAWNPQFIPQD
jgi:catechol 2,3-dioxygenase-like lactoylglutathione lyase family enzyme